MPRRVLILIYKLDARLLCHLEMQRCIYVLSQRALGSYCYIRSGSSLSHFVFLIIFYHLPYNVMNQEPAIGMILTTIWFILFFSYHVALVGSSMMMHCPMMKTYYAEMAHGFLLLLGSSSPLYLPPHVTAAAAAVGNCHQKDLSGIQVPLSFSGKIRYHICCHK